MASDLYERPICRRHCSVCEGQDHHWMQAYEADGTPIMICKHCDVERPMYESDFEY